MYSLHEIYKKKSWQLISSFGALFPSLSAADYGSVQHFVIAATECRRSADHRWRRRCD